jgi:hypothetical protein
LSVFTRGRPSDQDATAPEHVVPRWREVSGRVLTVLAFLLVFFALVAPNDLSKLTPAAFVRIPVEALVGVIVLLVLPPTVRRVVAAVLGVLLGLLTIVKIADMGFIAILNRPFDPLLDWSFLGPAVDFVKGQVGEVGTVAAEIGAGLLVVGLLVLTTAATLRLTRLAASHRSGTTRGVAVLAVIWMVCAPTGAQLTPGDPIAASSATALALENVKQVSVDIQEQRQFNREASNDAFAGKPGSGLLAGLRGTNVLITFVESYGRVAVQGTDFSKPIDALLDAGTQQLKAAGFDSRSAFLTSSTFGGGSWLAHSTLESGLWINNPQRYTELVNGNRLTLARAFKEAGWKTVADDPANTTDWEPEGEFYGYDQVFDSRDVGYKGPIFSYATMPDQYTMAAFQRNEMATPNHQPVMAEIDLVSSHVPWAPLPTMVDWNAIGDGSVFDPQPAAGEQVGQVWPDQGTVRAAYGDSIQYSLSTLISYVKTYGDDNLVLVFLGDHQPGALVSGNGPNRDVPITIVAHDKSVLDKISSWGWQDGLRPSPNAPVWQMSAFRDKFMTAFAK